MVTEQLPESVKLVKNYGKTSTDTSKQFCFYTQFDFTIKTLEKWHNKQALNRQIFEVLSVFSHRSTGKSFPHRTERVSPSIATSHSHKHFSGMLCDVTGKLNQVG